LAAHELALGMFMVLVPQQFNSPVYAGLAPNFETYAVLLLLGGVLLVLAAVGVGPPAMRAAMVTLSAGPLAVLALRFLSLGFLTALPVYGLEAIAALAVAASFVVPRLRRLRLLQLLCGLVAVALGALLVVSPGSFSPAAYGFITFAPLPLGLSFVGSGALLLLVEGRRGTSLAVPAGVLGGTSFALMAASATIAHTWTGTLVLGFFATADFLLLAKPLRLRHLTVLLAAAVAAVAGFDLLTWISPLDAIRPASNTLRVVPAIAVLLVCAGQVAAQREVRGWVRIASGAGIAVVLAGLGCAGYATLYTGITPRPGLLMGPSAGGPMDLYVGVGLQVALAGALLYASANAPVGRWTPHLIAVLAGVGLVGIGAVNLLAYGLGVGNLFEALGPLPMRADAAVAMLFVGVGFIIPTLPRIARGPIAGRVFTGLAMIALLILLQSFITEAASRSLVNLAGSDPAAAGRLLDAAVAARNGLALLIGSAMLATGIVLTRTVTRPVEDLRAALTRLAAGERAARATIIQLDELGELGAAFNAMATELDALHDELERRVEQRTAELQSAQALNRAVLETAVDGITVIDEAGTIQTFNPAAERIFGWTAEEVIGRNVNLLMPEPYHAAHAGYLHHYLTTGEKRIIGSGREVEGRRKDGTRFPLELGISEMRVGEVRLFAGITRDISTQKSLLLVAEQANRAKSEFLANMSHELRTPLNAILGFSELLDERIGTTLDASQRGWLHNIQTAGRHLLDLINDVLDISKVEAGRYEIRPEQITLADLLAPVLTTAGQDAQARGLLFDASDAPAITVVLDPLRTRQVLHNLLSNAVKFTERGGHVRLATAVTGQDLRFVVSDTGVGISAGDQGRVFGLFERLHEGRHEASGTGLGLALTRRLVELQGGGISFTSEVGVGTTFTVSLPGAVHAKMAGPRILIVEDDQHDAALIAALVAETGLPVEFAVTGGAGLATARHDPPTAIVLDLRLPDMRGEAVLEALQSDGGTSRIPVIVVTLEDDEGRSRRLGAADHLTKPIDAARLRGWLGRVIQGQQGER